MSGVQNALGDRGELIVRILLTRFHGRSEPFFHPQFLGEKYPTIDLFVELVGVPHPFVPYFFAQVKTTTRGYTVRENKLRVQVWSKDMRRLMAYPPAPTYIIGVDEPNELGYILAATEGGADRISSLTTRHSLSEGETLQYLYDEVLQYWQDYGREFQSSRFAMTDLVEE